MREVMNAFGVFNLYASFTFHLPICDSRGRRKTIHRSLHWVQYVWFAEKEDNTSIYIRIGKLKVSLPDGQNCCVLTWLWSFNVIKITHYKLTLVTWLWVMITLRFVIRLITWQGSQFAIRLHTWRSIGKPPVCVDQWKCNVFTSNFTELSVLRSLLDKFHILSSIFDGALVRETLRIFASTLIEQFHKFFMICLITLKYQLINLP